MNILYIALLMCVVYRVFASGSDTSSVVEQVVPLKVASEEDIAKSLEVRKFVGAVQEGDIRTMKIVFKAGNDKLKEHCVEHLISLESSERVKLIKEGHCYSIKSWMLGVILIHADKTIFNTVSAEINSTECGLALVAHSADLASNTDKFFYLLEKISDKEFQKWAVEYGAAALVEANKPEHLDHLLSALEDEPSLGPSMKDVAIQQAFETASFYTEDTEDRILYTDNFFDHPAILKGNYSDALFQSYRFGGSKSKHFLRLLEKADRQDLEQVKRDLEQVKREEWFSEQSPEFQKAVNKALKAVGPDARIGIRRRIMEPVLTDLLPKDLFGIIFGYASIDLAMPRASGEAASTNVPLPENPETPNNVASTPTNHGPFGYFGCLHF